MLDGALVMAGAAGAELIVMEKACVALAPALSCTVTLPLENTPADDGVPVNDTLLPLTSALRPTGRPLAANREYGEVPPLIAIVPGKPDVFTVQLVTDSAPRPGAELIVMEKVFVALAPALSCTVTLPPENTPGDVGVPEKDTLLPLTTALRPTGRPLAANREYGEVPPLIAIVPGKPDVFTVQLDADNAPRPGAELIVMEKVCVALATAPALSCTVTLPLENTPGDVGVPEKDTLLPLTTALRPTGRPLAANREYGEVPPLIAIVPGKPDVFTVQLDADNAPRLRAASVVTPESADAGATPTIAPPLARATSAITATS